MLDKQQFELFWVKVVERTCNINNAFGPGTASKCTVQWWFKKFAKETRTLKMRSIVASHQKLTMINWEDHWSWSSYNYLRSCQRTRRWPFYGHSAFEANWKGEKAQSMGASRTDQKFKKCHFEVSSFLILRSNNEPFRSDCNMRGKVDCVWQPAQWLDPEEASKHFPKSDLHQKKVVVTVWWSAAHLIHYSFLNPSETITSEKYAQQIDEMHGKLQCLQLALVNRMGPVLLHDNAWPHIAQPMLQKLNELGYGVLLHLPYLPDLSIANWLPLLQASQQLFAG